ncbi:ACP S-malonyltransferase [Lichenihabitans psoromatis]|uniref:ACP S-malonyltransferase n=1 Tax=Lichenihabitans psoromatis TaxID=2528642 RepID=UPI0010383754|nr:ACP S-malonyltransferase [Lichenihabitans psoromatis]
MTTAFMFPGQGSQSVGMGKALADRFPEARAVFDEVDAALGQELSATIFEGPEADLTATANAQPALMATSLAVVRVLQAHAGLDLATQAAFVAGHSLGEYSALAAAGALSIFDAARLLRLRGEAMQAAVPAGVGAMAALLGTDAEQAGAIAADAAEGDVCDIANDNGGGQVVLSGHAAAIDRAIALAKQRGVKRAVLLNVSAPFHCGLMRSAADKMQDALATVSIHPPVVPLVANRDGKPVSDVASIRQSLVAQICGTVRWRDVVLTMAEAGVDDLVELGSGAVLCGLVKRITPGLRTISVGTPADIEAFAAARNSIQEH